MIHDTPLWIQELEAQQPYPWVQDCHMKDCDNKAVVCTFDLETEEWSCLCYAHATEMGVLSEHYHAVKTTYSEDTHGTTT